MFAAHPQLAPKELPHTVTPTAFVSVRFLTQVATRGESHGFGSSLSNGEGI